MKDVRDDRVGDKVGVLSGEHRGHHAVIAQVATKVAVVALNGDAVTLPLSSLQNFSAAARKAWRTRPDRAAGRPRNPHLPAKRMVSLRVSEDVWDGLGRAVERGLIRSREAAVNEWLLEKWEQLRGKCIG